MQSGSGCWAIGGPAYRDGAAIGWGEVDDEESVAAVHAGIEAGVSFFDTANVYGTGHSERVLGRALKGHGRRRGRHEVRQPLRRGDSHRHRAGRVRRVGACAVRGESAASGP